MTKAIAYLRTSSAANVGGDSDVRQRTAIAAYAKANGIEIVAEFNDEAVSGTDPIETRPGFAAMLDRIEGNGVRTVIVDEISRFARTLMTQELGIVLLQQRGVRLLASNGDDLTDTDDEMRVAFRQMAGILVQLEKTRLVKKLKGARDRASATAGKRVEGRKGYAVENPATVEAIRSIRTADPRATLHTIAERLTSQGIRTATGRPLLVQQIHRICKANRIGKEG